MNDPLNQLPTDPEWLKACEEISQDAAKRLGCMVVMVALQDGGKAFIGIEGVPEKGPLADMAKDPPRLLITAAQAAYAQDLILKAKPQ